MGARLGDDRAAVGVPGQHDRPVVRVDDPPGGGGVLGQGDDRVLHHGDVVAVLGQQVIHPAPAGPVGERAVPQDDGPVGELVLMMISFPGNYLGCRPR